MIEQTQHSAHLQRILEERARALARAPKSETPGETVELVVVALRLERYGIDVQHVQEIQPLAGLTPVPGLPSFWMGVVNLRGRLHPVLNLRRYLGLPAATSDEGSKVVLVSAANLNVALLVDDVPGVRRVPQTEIGPPLTEATDVQRNAQCVRGVTPDLLAVLDLEALLADSELVVQEKSV
ncbi:MAG: chemotaxis protein CheW [Anaerolineales bacterium]